MINLHSVNRVESEAIIAADPNVAPATRIAAESIAINGRQLIGVIDDILNSSSPIISRTDRAGFDKLPAGATFRYEAGGKVYRKPGGQ